MAHRLQLDRRAARPQDPLRRPTARLNSINQSPRPHTQKLGQSRRHRRAGPRSASRRPPPRRRLGCGPGTRSRHSRGGFRRDRPAPASWAARRRNWQTSPGRHTARPNVLGAGANNGRTSRKVVIDDRLPALQPSGSSTSPTQTPDSAGSARGSRSISPLNGSSTEPAAPADRHAAPCCAAPPGPCCARAPSPWPTA
jgi:hypothetical protein